MALQTLSLTIADHVAHLRLDRPEALNTMILPFWHDMVAAFDTIADDASVRAVVISSTGRHFTAGLDLSVFDSLTTKEAVDSGRIGEQLRRTVFDMQESFSVIDRSRVPVIVAVQGGCIGGGIDLISACDVRLCAADAFFCIQEVNVGIVADVGTLQRLPHLIPAGLVRELAYTGRRMAADEARASGLVNAVFDGHDELVDGALAMAATIAEKSPLAITGTKEMLNYARDHTIADGLNHVATWQAGMMQTEDVARQVAANKAKAAAQFDDLLAPKRPATRGA
jgi:enoyl-CoA hydratase